MGARVATLPSEKLILPPTSLQLAKEFVSAKRRLMLARQNQKDGKKVEFHHDGVIQSFLDSVSPTANLHLATNTLPIPAIQQLRMSEFVRHLAEVVRQPTGYILIFVSQSKGQYDTQGDYAYDVALERLLKLNPKRVQILDGSKVIDYLPTSAPKGMGAIFRAVSGNLEPHDGKKSRRCAKCMLRSPKDLDLFLLESDAGQTLDDKFGPNTWQRIYGSLPFGVVSVVDSGHRGDHVLCLSNPAIQEALPQLKNLFVLLGADHGAFTSTQITRVGGAIRGSTGREQAWLYRADGILPLPSAAKAKCSFVSIQEFVNRLSSLVENQREDMEAEITRCDDERAQLQPGTAAPKPKRPKPGIATKASPGLAKPQSSGNGAAFRGKFANEPQLIGGGTPKQNLRQAAFRRVLEIRGEAIRKKLMRIGGDAPPQVVARAADESGYTEAYVEYIYSNYPLNKSGITEAKEWVDYDGKPFGPLAVPVKRGFIGEFDGPSRFLPHKDHWGASGSKVQLLNELGHSCMSLQVTARMTEEEEIVFLLEFRRLQQAKFAQPMAQALATALGRPVDYQIMGNVIIPDDTVPPWTRDSADLQIQKAVILQNLHERYTTVAVQENLRALMDDLRECFGSERELTRELRKDVRRRRKKWPNGVPTASASHFLPLYVSLLGIWKTSQKTVFSKSEILSIGTEGGHIVSQPGTALRRKQRVVIRNDHSPMDFNRLKAKAEGKMADRCMDTLEALGLVKPWPNMKAKLRRPGKPERRWRLWRPNLQLCKMTAKLEKFQ